MFSDKMTRFNLNALRASSVNPGSPSIEEYLKTEKKLAYEYNYLNIITSCKILNILKYNFAKVLGCGRQQSNFRRAYLYAAAE